MIDLGIISLGISASVAVIQLLNFLSAKSISASDKHAKLTGLENELDDMKDDVFNLSEKVSELRVDLSSIQVENGICETQHERTHEDYKQILKNLEIISERIEDLR